MRMSARDERLADFLLARIAEDEANAADCGCIIGGTVPDALVERRLAEVAAKREIVADFRRWELLARGGDMSALGTASGARVACLRLVAVYKDHPDFDEVWLP